MVRAARHPLSEPQRPLGSSSPMAAPFSFSLAGEGGEMRFSSEPDEGYSLTLPYPHGTVAKLIDGQGFAR
jgi:hypothetical protein